VITTATVTPTVTVIVAIVTATVTAIVTETGAGTRGTAAPPCRHRSAQYRIGKGSPPIPSCTHVIRPRYGVYCVTIIAASSALRKPNHNSTQRYIKIYKY
jgi:hypothetical protein